MSLGYRLSKENVCSGEEKQIPSSPVKGSFKETLKSVKDRIEWNCLPQPMKARACELAMIIAEVELLPPDAPVRIEGTDLAAEYVAEIYSMLRSQHIEFVLDNLAGTNHRIMSIKTYVRTALYNAVLTLEIATDNVVQSEIRKG